MDGLFVPNITVGPLIVAAARPVTKLFFDVHLMIEFPDKYIDQFIEAGSDLVTFHIEVCKNPEGIIRKVRAMGRKVGVSLKPATKLSSLSRILDKVDLVLVMTVEPGFGGQSFMEDMMDKVRELKKSFDKYIQVDGGINKDTALKAVEAGANVLVAGTAVFGQGDYKQAISDLRGRRK
jgi:ribulose-phosphate 3-epimerase